MRTFNRNNTENVKQEHTKFIFTDQDGDVLESDFEPVNVSSGWRGTGFCSWWFSQCEPYQGNWEDSLEKRP